jgi:hypothetical protein
MDDVNWKNIPAAYADSACDNILNALQRNNVKAALFAVGQNVDNPEGRSILDRWAKAGHLLGNHTWSHKNYHSVTPEWFEEDILKNEALLKSWPNYRRFFRFPLLKEGKTAAIRDAMRRFLAKHGYHNAAVTIDASDWYYDQRLRTHLAAVEQFRAPYLKHLWDRAHYYNDLSVKVLGRCVQHTILVHYNLINSLYLGDALTMFRQQGWDLISAEAAFRDPVFKRQPKTAPAGESLIWALAKETGRFETMLRYPGEDDVYEKPILDHLGL